MITNTHRGLYQYTRLPFGVSSAPAIFQKVMDTVLQGLPKIISYLDDILISASTPEEHLDNVKQVPYNAKRWRWKTLANSTENYIGEKILVDSNEKQRSVHWRFASLM